MMSDVGSLPEQAVPFFDAKDEPEGRRLLMWSPEVLQRVIEKRQGCYILVAKDRRFPDSKLEYVACVPIHEADGYGPLLFPEPLSKVNEILTDPGWPLSSLQWRWDVRVVKAVDFLDSFYETMTDRGEVAYVIETLAAGIAFLTVYMVAVPPKESS